jgi:hypothetical protein
VKAFYLQIWATESKGLVGQKLSLPKGYFKNIFWPPGQICLIIYGWDEVCICYQSSKISSLMVPESIRNWTVLLELQRLHPKMHRSRTYSVAPSVSHAPNFSSRAQCLVTRSIFKRKEKEKQKLETKGLYDPHVRPSDWIVKRRRWWLRIVWADDDRMGNRYR